MQKCHHYFILISCLFFLTVSPALFAKETTQPLSTPPKTITSTNSDETHFHTNAVTQNINFAEHFLTILNDDDSIASQHSIEQIHHHWNPGLIAMALETISRAWLNPHRPALVELLKHETENQGIYGIDQWYHWLWNSDIKPDDSYSQFKAVLYRKIDSRFEHYFHDRQHQSTIRFDEIQWGGVVQDGIPPLRNPIMVKASQASYLDDNDIVFGIEINGDVRAYPKRILAWHEMFTDTIGGVDITGVYCTLCGMVIPFRSQHKGIKHVLGTSGFLYRSNKLMYDKATQSLWSTTRGEPVVGPLVGKDIKLEFESVVTTTWGEWRSRHPDTLVLSLDTGHSRDYGEGVAYDFYFGTDALMFRTPYDDKRLKNKQEVLALRFPAAPNQQLAIDTAFLEKNPIYSNRIGAQTFVVLTDKSGANRVYDPQEIRFTDYDGNQTLTDEHHQQWHLSESGLISENQRILPRLPYHRAFWFGWHAAYPKTKLIK